MRKQAHRSSRFGIKTGLPRDETSPVWDDRRAQRDERHLLPFYGAVAAVSLTIGIVNALSAAQDAAWRGAAYNLATPLLWEMTSIVTILALAPLLFAAVQRMRRTAGWPFRIGLAIAAIVVFSALHIAGMVMLRKFVMALAGASMISVSRP